MLELMLSSLFAFMIIACTIEVGFWFFSVRQYRLRYLIRLLPILKLPIDLLFPAHLQHNILYNFNPLSCEKPLRKWLAGYIDFPFDLQLHFIPEIFVVLTLIITLVATIKLISANRALQRLLANAQPCNRAVRSKELQNARVLLSGAITTPMALPGNTILFPSQLVLSQDEYEAVLAHEKEHLKWRDPTLKSLMYVISALFWWIPTKWWLNRITEEQENACDACIQNYACQPQALAEAMLKVIKTKKSEANFVTCGLHAKNNSVIRRLQNVLRGDPMPKLSLWHALVALTTAFIVYSFWVC